MAFELTCGGGYGRALRRRGVGRVALTESVYAAGDVIPPHYHATVQLSLVLQGAYEERVGGTKLHCEPAALLLHRPGDVHSDHFSGAGSRCLNVALSDDLLTDWMLDEGPDGWPSVRLGIPSRYAFELRERLWAPEPPPPDDLEELALALVDHLIAGPAFHAPAHPPPWLRTVRAWVHGEYRRPPSLADLAAEAGVHRTHVARAFRRHFGCTVGEYARRRRVEFACRRLLEGKEDLSAVAYAGGFADQAHFTRDFRRLVGTTPGAFRRRYRAVGVS